MVLGAVLLPVWLGEVAAPGLVRSSAAGSRPTVRARRRRSSSFNPCSAPSPEVSVYVFSNVFFAQSLFRWWSGWATVLVGERATGGSGSPC